MQVLPSLCTLPFLTDLIQRTLPLLAEGNENSNGRLVEELIEGCQTLLTMSLADEDKENESQGQIQTLCLKTLQRLALSPHTSDTLRTKIFSLMFESSSSLSTSPHTQSFLASVEAKICKLGIWLLENLTEADEVNTVIILDCLVIKLHYFFTLKDNFEILCFL